MKPVKLLTLTSWTYLVIFLVLTLFFFEVFYVFIKKEVLRSTDEVLYNKKGHIIAQFKKNGGMIPPEVFGYTDFSIIPVSGRPAGQDRYSDTIIFEPIDQEWDEFRKLSSFFTLDEKPYKLEMVTARMETHEIVGSIIESLLIVFLLMVIVFYLTTRYFSKRLWQPFYSTLRQLSDFEVDKMRVPDLAPSRIEEFATLNKAILELTERTQTTFSNQKQFIENASHEMQTPLAIAQSKLELLIEDPHLTKDQSEIIQALITSTLRLAKLNKTLLLLSKIENQQFIEKEEIHLRPLIKEILAYFEEQQETLRIHVELEIADDDSLKANPMLVDLLLTNLIKNAFSHNVLQGSIRMKVNPTSFEISNTSSGEVIPQGKLFQRFYKQSMYKESWGLGLAIVKKICEINQWRISYSKQSTHHLFTIFFS